MIWLPHEQGHVVPGKCILNGRSLRNSFVPNICRLQVWNAVDNQARKAHTSIIHGKYSHEETIATASFATTYLILRDLEEAEYVADYILRGGDKQEFLAKCGSLIRRWTVLCCEPAVAILAAQKPQNSVQILACFCSFPMWHAVVPTLSLSRACATDARVLNLAASAGSRMPSQRALTRTRTWQRWAWPTRRRCCATRPWPSASCWSAP